MLLERVSSNSPRSTLGTGNYVTARIEHCVDGAVHADLALHSLGYPRVHAALNRRLTRLLLAYGQIYLAGHGAAGTSTATSCSQRINSSGAAIHSTRAEALSSLGSQISAPFVQRPPGLVMNLPTRMLDIEDIALAQLRVLHEHGGDSALEIPGKLIGDHAPDLVAHVEGVALRNRAIETRGNGLLGQLDLQLLAIVVVVDVLQLEGASERLGSSNSAKGDATKSNPD